MKQNILNTLKQPMWWIALVIASIITTALLVNYKSVAQSWQLSWYDGGVFAGIMTSIGIFIAPVVLVLAIVLAITGKW